MLHPTLESDENFVNEAAPCCTPEEAWLWVSDFAEGALTGDDHYRGKLPFAIEHALRAEAMSHIVSMEGLRREP